jgi:hypothetical protein
VKDLRLRDRCLHKRRAQEFEVQEISIDELVPGELVLEEDAVKSLKAAITSGNKIEMPRVTPIGGAYYVLDGNHRIMAMKLLGLESAMCRVQPYRPLVGVADYDTDKCNGAVAKGYLGFNRIKLGSKADKGLAYDEEEDDFFEDLLV